MEFVPYKSNEILENKYYQIPQELFVNKKYKDKLNSDSKILYAFLLDRITLSQKNHWIDKENKIYLIFMREEVATKLNLSEKTVIKAFKQLTEVNLIQEKRQGLGKPNLIYVGKIVHEEIEENTKDKGLSYIDVDNIDNVSNRVETDEIILNSEQKNLQLQNCKNYSSGDVKNTVQELENLQGINTKSINPNTNDDVLNNLKIQCKLNEFSQEEKVILEDIIDGLYFKENLRVDNAIINNLKIKEKLKLINKNNLMLLLEILKNTSNIKIIYMQIIHTIM